MSNELNIMKEESAGNIAETFLGEDKGVMDENKIVSIVNKTNPAESVNTATPTESTEPTVQASAHSSEEPNVHQVDRSREEPVVHTAAHSWGEPVADTGSAARTSAGTSDSNASPERTARMKTSSYAEDYRDSFDFDEDERPKKRFFRFRSANEEESRDKLILSRIKDEDLMEYLALEQRRLEFLQQSKEAKEKRILIAFQLLISLAAIVAITYLLQDNPTILISILYIVGIVAALNVWKNPPDKGGWRR